MTITQRTPVSAWSRWPIWAIRAAWLWSAIYAVLGVFWALGGMGFPFGAGDVNAEGRGTLLAEATAPVTGSIMAVLGAAGVVVGWAMSKQAERPRAVLLLFGWGMAALLVLVLPEIRALTVALFPLVFLMLDKMDWPMVNFLILMAGGFLWAGATLAYQRESRSACAHCGRGAGGGRGRAEAWLLRRGRTLTYVAAAAPWGYALVRLAWVLDLPLGVPPEFLRQMESANGGAGAKGMELVLVGMCATGSVLTVGLVRRWGEVWPSWVPGFAGRPVPVAFPVASAGLAAVGVTAVGLSWARGLPEFVANGLTVEIEGHRMGPIFGLPIPSFLVWGVSLGLSALAYYYRRAGHCVHCRTAPTESSME
ncbi:hypothetical protein Ppa06_46470 [Planomonospora parontospora subsp. parontospora]|uniref:Uncharacterized protein n=2 Tax=Planomonospora parontospora TaxID=58119 RepID=A0AA37BL25_9ACTN|nr:hypothetical protein [Planomonospora parontospora]GGK86385.1 hypothetical protein GCM10010126_52060 [Planomonospora parontospora]GII10849.1 hypothetical protein Ppa06_46470 [Planomonospora parontospora subsp. parontospora]